MKPNLDGRPEDYWQRPGYTGLYRLYDAEDRLLYVGIGSSPASRWKDHERDKDWWPQVARKTVEWFQIRADAAAAELAAIQTEDPVHNQVGVPGRHWTATKAPQQDAGLPIQVARANLGKITARIEFTGEKVAITRHGRRVAWVVPDRWMQQVLAQLGMTVEELPD